MLALLLAIDQHDVASKAKELGDLGLVVADKEWKSDTNLSLLDVYSKLLELEKLSGIGSQEERSNYTLSLLQDLDPLSAQFVIRIIFGKLRLGFSDMTLIDALSVEWESGDKSLHNNFGRGL